MTPHFTLTVAASADGFIAPARDVPPQTWASAEEQKLFFEDLAAADWAVMGRRTHEVAPSADRRRIIFSRQGGGWRRPSQVWLDPDAHDRSDLAALVDGVHPLRRGLILGGTTVHDWFLDRGAVDAVHLTVEPHRFGDGLPILTGQTATDPVALFRALGFAIRRDRILNAAGTRHLVLTP